jgi:hypothetical protein
MIKYSNLFKLHDVYIVIFKSIINYLVKGLNNHLESTEYTANSTSDRNNSTKKNP